jgi:hypothetical protein
MNEFASEAVQVRCRAERWADRFFLFQDRFGRVRATSVGKYRIPLFLTNSGPYLETLVKNWRGSPGGLLVRAKTSSPGGSRSDSMTATGGGSVKHRLPLTLHPKDAELTDRFRHHPFPYMPHFVAAHEH